MDYMTIICPHCKDVILVYIKEFNCRIFRHGVYINNQTQIDPHLDKKTCDYLYENKLIYGCGKPFKIVGINEPFDVEICDYI